MTRALGRAGLFIDDTRVAFVVERGAHEPRVVERTLAAAESLADVVHAVMADAGDISGLTVIIGRPWAHLRTIEMPPLPRETAERVIARDCERYVIGSGPCLVSARPMENGRWVAAFVSSDVIGRISAALSALATTPIVFATVDDVFATTNGVPSRRGERIVVVCDANGPSDIACVRDSVAIAGRRFLPTANSADVVAFAAEHLGARAAVAIVGDATQARIIAAGCGSAGIHATVVSLSASIATSASSIATLALDTSPQLAFRPPGDRARTQQRDNAVTRWLLAGIAAAIILGGVLEQQIVSSRMDHVVTARAAIASQVTHAIASRDSLQAATELVSTIANREAHASRAGGALAAITLALPPGATLTSLQVAGDSVLVEGQSRDGAAVYDALKKVRELDQVILAAPLRSERAQLDAGGAIGHFAFSAHLRGGGR